MKQNIKGVIKNIKKQDLLRCQDIIYSCFYDVCKNVKQIFRLRKHYSLLNLEKFLKSSKIFIVFRGEGKILGTGRITKNNEVRTIYVNPKYQKRGIGTKIIKKLEDYAKKHKIKKLYLHAMSSAVPFYIKKGYIKSKGFLKKDNLMEKKI
jgi:N-acetylglutamate synthase-like GNAT family acetyltransferase